MARDKENIKSSKDNIGSNVSSYCICSLTFLEWVTDPNAVTISSNVIVLYLFIQTFTFLLWRNFLASGLPCFYCEVPPEGCSVYVPVSLLLLQEEEVLPPSEDQQLHLKHTQTCDKTQHGRDQTSTHNR